MSAVTIPNTAPQLIEIATADFLDRFDAMTHKSALVTIASNDQKLAAEAMAKSLREMAKEITATRKQGTAQLDAIVTAAIARERDFTDVIDKCWKALTARIQVYIDAENVRRAEAQRLAREEQERLQKIENNRADAERARLQAEVDASTPPDIEPQQVAPTVATPVYVPERYVPPPLTSGATKKKTDYALEYIDREKIPAFSASGHELRTINESALKLFLKSLPEGKREIPGAVRLVTTTGIAAKG